MLITNYQVISPILDLYDNSPNQWHHPSVSFPLRGNSYHNVYRTTLFQKLRKKK